MRFLRSLTTNTAVTAAANLVLAFFGMATGIVTARLLGPQGRGELAAIQITPSVIGTLALVGVPEALTYYSARNPRNAWQYLCTASILGFVMSMPAMIIGSLAMPILLHAQNPGIVTDARWYLLIAPTWAMTGLLPQLVRGVGDFVTWNIMRLIVSICAGAVLLVAWLVGYKSAHFIAFGNLGANALLFAPFLWIARWRVIGSYSFERSQIRPLLRYGLPCAMAGLPQLLNLRLDQMLMAAIVPPHDLGLYVVAVAWSGAVSPLLTSVGVAILPSVASAEQPELAISRLIHGGKVACTLALVVCCVMILATPLAVISLFGSHYRAAIPAALVLVPAAGVLGINLTLQESIRALGFPYPVLKAELIGLCVTSLSLALTLRPFGIFGAAVSSLLGYSAVMSALLASAKRLASTSARELLIPSPDELRSALRQLCIMVRTVVTAQLQGY
jgi:enterobacterial common antigen flippase